MEDEVTNLAWSDVHPGIRVRMVTPAWVRRGTVTRMKKRDMEVRWDGIDRPQQIPNARWYFAQYKYGNMTEHIVTIAGRAPQTPKRLQRTAKGKDWGNELITPAIAANILGVDPKALRRMIRSGKVPATQEGGRWVLRRSDVEKVRR